jgi:outer membrane protein assembly factor BamB
MYMNSPVISGSWLFGFSHRQKGQFFCLDLESGRTLWTGDPRQGENAAMLLVDGHLLALTEQAELLVTTVASKGATLVRQHRVADSPTWAHPVLTGRRLLIKEAAHLRVWELN